MSAQTIEPAVDVLVPVEVRSPEHPTGHPTGHATGHGGVEQSHETAERVAVRPVLRLLPAPVREPAVPDPGRGPDGTAGSVAAPTVRHLPLGRPAPPVPLEPDAEQAPPADQPRRPAPTSVLPDPVRWAGQFVQAATEVCAGLRPVVQLVRWTSEEVYTTMTRRHKMSARALRAGRVTVPGGRLRVRSVRACVVRDGIVEAAAVVFDGVRARAVAVRLEGFDGRWRVTAFELG